MPTFIDLTGRIFGRLTVVGPLQQRANGGVVWQCQCECGNIAEVRGQCLRKGHTKSCGCLFLEVRRMKKEHTCQQCKQPFYYASTNQKCCSKECARLLYWTPETRLKHSKLMQEQALSPGPFRDAVYERMTKNNPASSLEAREKISARTKGRPFPAKRGGNGQGFSLPQQHLLDLLGNPWQGEYKVFGGGRDGCLGQKWKWPIMSVDIALPDQKVALEINGQSHNNFKVRERDARKKEILTALGWQVFSFKNEEVLEAGERIAGLLKRFQ